eukprot:1161424-Pelagomonas_calceolata.AAC.6
MAEAACAEAAFSCGSHIDRQRKEWLVVKEDEEAHAQHRRGKKPARRSNGVLSPAKPSHPNRSKAQHRMRSHLLRLPTTILCSFCSAPPPNDPCAHFQHTLHLACTCTGCTRIPYQHPNHTYATPSSNHTHPRNSTPVLLPAHPTPRSHAQQSPAHPAAGLVRGAAAGRIRAHEGACSTARAHPRPAPGRGAEGRMRDVQHNTSLMARKMPRKIHL